jgi:uncharacterized protein
MSKVQEIQQFLPYAKKCGLGIGDKSVVAVLELASEGATVPFIARYRKEKTGNLDEVQIRRVIETHETWVEIVKRKAFVLEEIEKQGQLTGELKTQIEAALELAEVEELYRPYKKKKKTKAKIAMDAGMGPLADWIWGLGHGEIKDATSLEVKAKEFLNPEAQFATYEECLRGAQHIIVERLSNNPELRKLTRDDFFEKGVVVTEKSKDFKPNSKFSMYAEFKEPVKILMTKKASHRYLAIRRGWQEEELKVTITSSNDMLLSEFQKVACTALESQAKDFLYTAAKTALNVHVIPSVTNELHTLMKEKADRFSIEVFADNVRRLLMSSPYGSRVVLGIDPGLRTGCKMALVDRSGKYITDTVLHILGDGAEEKAKALFEQSLKQIQIDAVAIGNGTAGRETEVFIRKIFKAIGREDIPIVMVNEAGASVYSASDVAREEFPNLDVTVRGAISIARRLQDPLAELVKIDPKSIGVGQYQHDVNQAWLKKSLEGVVESCVNQVGVDLNTASSSLLQHVSGIGPGIAKNIIEFREQKGLFQERSDLLKVPHFTSKAFEQAAGFLRIRDGKSPLDQTGIHPERYQAVKDLLNDAGLKLSQVLGGDIAPLRALKPKWSALIGEYTFEDILTELSKPGRDPRGPFKVFKYREDIHEIKDLKEGMLCPGIVTNVTNFGAFVDIGVHQDGLVHISQLTHQFVQDPKEVVKPGDQVQVKVLGVDLEKNQIALTMLLEERPKPEPKPRPRPEEGARRDGPREPRRDGPRHEEGRPQREARGPREDSRRDGRRDSQRDHRHENNRDQRGPRNAHDNKRRDGGRPQAQPFNNPFAAALTNLKK